MLNILIAIIALTLIGVIAYDFSEIYKRKNAVKEAERARVVYAEQKKKEVLIKHIESEYNTTFGNLISTYGECSLDVLLGSRKLNTSDHVYFFEQRAMMVLKNESIPFEKIIGFSLNDDTETIMKNETSYISRTSTSTGSLLGRAMIGGVLGGGLGAFAGAITAKKETISAPSWGQTTTFIKHKYSLYLNIDSISNPTRNIELGDDIQKAQILANAINVIIQRNKK